MTFPRTLLSVIIHEPWLCKVCAWVDAFVCRVQKEGGFGQHDLRNGKKAVSGELFVRQYCARHLHRVQQRTLRYRCVLVDLSQPVFASLKLSV